MYFFAFFRFFHFFSLFFEFFRIFSHFLAFFRFKFFASLRFSNFCFDAKQSEAKFKYIFSFFFAFFGFFCLFHLFSLNFRFASIFSLNFRLFYLRFRFRFLVFRIEVNHVKSGFFFSLRSETKFSLQYKISLPKRKWGRTLGLTNWPFMVFPVHNSQMASRGVAHLVSGLCALCTKHE